jgi:hypothetical protein
MQRNAPGEFPVRPTLQDAWRTGNLLIPLELETNAMKITLFLLCFLCATAALGQTFAASALSNEVQPLQMVSHPAHASQHAMSPEQSLLDGSNYVYEHGERPLWEFAPVSRALPLGDVARILRQEHVTAKKADFVRND